MPESCVPVLLLLYDLSAPSASLPSAPSSLSPFHPLPPFRPSFSPGTWAESVTASNFCKIKHSRCQSRFERWQKPTEKPAKLHPPLYGTGFPLPRTACLVPYQYFGSYKSAGTVLASFTEDSVPSTVPVVIAKVFVRYLCAFAEDSVPSTVPMWVSDLLFESRLL